MEWSKRAKLCSESRVKHSSIPIMRNINKQC